MRVKKNSVSGQHNQAFPSGEGILPRWGRWHGFAVTDEEITVCTIQKAPSSSTASGSPSPLEKAKNTRVIYQTQAK